MLGKPGKLTDEEYAIIRTHPTLGQRMLSGHPFSALVMDAVFMHHEAPDGSGYPRRLKYADIPLAARIVGLCDAFDAMTSTWPYRRGMPVEKAVSIIRDNLGRQFDGDLGERFIALADYAELRHGVGHSDEGVPLQECLTCGPTIVLQRETAAGGHVYCHACGGGRGNAAALEARPDEALIARLVADSAKVLTASGVKAAKRRHEKGTA